MNRRSIITLLFTLFISICMTQAEDGWLTLPLPLVKEDTIRSAWIRDNGVTVHWAIDYGAPQGTPVLAAADGWAIASCQPPINGEHTYGRFVLIQHANGYSSLYAHLDSVLLQQTSYLCKDDESVNNLSRYKIVGLGEIQYAGKIYTRQWVRRGQTIGTVGFVFDTKGERKFHLHFEVAKNLDGGYASHKTGRSDPFCIEDKRSAYPPPDGRCVNVKDFKKYLWTACSPVGPELSSFPSWPSARHDRALTSRAEVPGPQAVNGTPPKMSVFFDPGDYLGVGPVTGQDGMLYVASGTTLYGVTRDGVNNWRWSIPVVSSIEYVDDIAVDSDNTVYVVTRKALYAVNPGTPQGSPPKWKYDLPGQGIKFLTLDPDPEGLVYITGGDSYFQHSVTALNKNGTTRWVFGDSPTSFWPAVDSSGTVYVISRRLSFFGGDGAVVAIRSDGSVKWACYAWHGCADLWGAPSHMVLGADQKLYVITRVPYAVTYLNIFDTHSGTFLGRRQLAGWESDVSDLAYSPQSGLFLILRFPESTVLRRVLSNPASTEDLFWARHSGFPVLDGQDNVYLSVAELTGGWRLVCLGKNKEILWSVPLSTSQVGLAKPIIGERNRLYFRGDDFKVYKIQDGSY